MNKQEIRAIVREMQRIVGILPPEDAGVFGKISAAFEAIIERDADTQRRLAALERVSGGTPGARGEETAAPTSPAAWTEEQRVAAVSTYSVLLDANARELHNDYWCEAIAKVAPLFAPPKPAPSVEDCERAYKSALEGVLGARIDVTKHERAAIAAVRALMLESNKGDGASVSGDSGPKAGHNMERGSGCPASDHHADRETSTPQGPKDPAPSPTFTPDRDALQKHLYWEARRPESWIASWESVANVSMTYFAPLIAERDALRKELAERCDQVDALQHERDKIMARLGSACQPHEIEDRIRGLQMRAGERDALRQHLQASRDLVKERAGERDALRARIAELERNLRFAEEARSGYEATADAVQTLGEFLSERGAVMAGHQHSYVVNAARKRIAELEARKPTVTRDAIAESITCHSQTTLTNIMVVVLKRAGIEVTP